MFLHLSVIVFMGVGGCYDVTSCYGQHYPLDSTTPWSTSGQYACYSNSFLFSVTFFILHNGTDGPNCGYQTTKACLTFPYLLVNFYKKYKPSNGSTLPTLNVSTDVDITIDDHLVVWFTRG